MCIDNLKLYEVSTYYVDYLKSYDTHMFFDYKSNDVRKRKYVDISCVRDNQYRSLLLAEYRYIKSIQEKVRKNARIVYDIRIRGDNKNPIAMRCNDFRLLEKACVSYSS